MPKWNPKTDKPLKMNDREHWLEIRENGVYLELIAAQSMIRTVGSSIVYTEQSYKNLRSSLTRMVQDGMMSDVFDCIANEWIAK